MDHNQENCKTQNLFKKEFIGKPKDNRGEKPTGELEEIEALAPRAKENIKNSPTPSQSNVKPHTKSLIASDLIILSGFR